MRQLIIPPIYTVKQAIRRLDDTGKKILMVVEEEVLLGVITDGDIRRWILKNGDLEDSVRCIMNRAPKVLESSREYVATSFMIQNGIDAVPLVDEQGKIENILFLGDLLKGEEPYRESINIPVVIMAGGKGTRLYPYTKILPKPLIPIGDQTILERILGQFTKVGCDTFYLTVNYKKNMIKSYMEDSIKDYTINYVEETDFLGTAGSLHMLKNELQETFFVSNCDILVDADYADLLKYHKQNEHKITLVTSLKNYTIPYGVIRTDATGCINEIQEKPEYNFQVNTGFYVLEPEVLKDIPENTFFHITELISNYMERGEKVGVYPVTEKCWLDMGELKEMEAMIQHLGLG